MNLLNRTYKLFLRSQKFQAKLPLKRETLLKSDSNSNSIPALQM